VAAPNAHRALVAGVGDAVAGVGDNPRADEELGLAGQRQVGHVDAELVGDGRRGVARAGGRIVGEGDDALRIARRGAAVVGIQPAAQVVDVAGAYLPARHRRRADAQVGQWSQAFDEPELLNRRAQLQKMHRSDVGGSRDRVVRPGVGRQAHRGAVGVDRAAQLVDVDGPDVGTGRCWVVGPVGHCLSSSFQCFAISRGVAGDRRASPAPARSVA